MTRRTIILLTVAALAALGGLLSISNRGTADQPQQGPFRNPIEQREQMIQELREIKELLQQQNDLLRRLQKD